jgi:hypothetical protein
MSCSSTDPCNQPSYSSDSIIYTGPGLPCTDIDPCDTITQAFEKAEEKVCVLLSTVISLQNQLNSLTTTTSTSSTSTTSTTSTSSTSTTSTTSGNPQICLRPKYPMAGTMVSLMFRKNGGPWTMLIYEPTPGNTFTQFGVGGSNPVAYNCPIVLSLTNVNPTIGDFIELYVVTGVGLQNVRFGNGYINPASIVGDFTSNCGQAAPFGFIYTPTQRYINVDSTEPVSPAPFGSIITC